jgi:serine protease inhibitor
MVMDMAALKPPTPCNLIVDRPFFLAIRDTLSGLLLFTASVQDP